MTLSGIVALFGALVVLAIIPSISVLLVSARSAAYGFIHGVFTTIGIAIGDVFFILVAMWGLSFLSETMGGLFFLVKLLGGAYLLWFGMKLWKSNSNARDIKVEGDSEPSLLCSLMTGLLITVGDQKVILFYFAFFPTFLDITTISYVDTIIIIIIDLVALGGAKIAYAYLADKSRLLVISDKARERMNIAAGCVMIGAGVFLVTTV